MAIRILKIVVAVSLTAVLLFGLMRHAAQIERNVALRDSIAYWAAGTLLIHHQNPYDHASVLQLERQHGCLDDRPLVLRTPPWSLFMVLGLGSLSPLWAWVAWLAVLLTCLVLGLRLTRQLYGIGDVPQNALTIAAYTFAPVPACLVSGQMGLVLMIGLILFLWLEPKRPFLAGFVLILPFAKPHLLALFWLALLIWVVVRRKRQLALGFATAFAVATLLSVVLDPQVFAHYHEMLKHAAIERIHSGAERRLAPSLFPALFLGAVRPDGGRRDLEPVVSPPELEHMGLAAARPGTVGSIGLDYSL